LILGCIIMAGCNANPAAASGKFDALIAELTDAFLTKNIQVFEPSIQVELAQNAAVKLLEFFPIDLERPWVSLSGGYKYGAASASILRIISESKIGRHVLTGYVPLHIEKRSYLPRGSLPIVLNYDYEFVPFRYDVEIAEPQIGPQLAIGGILHNVNRLSQTVSLNDEGHKLEYGNQSQGNGYAKHIPIGWWLILMCGACLGGLGSILWGVENDQRGIFRAPPVLGGLLRCILSLSLLLVTFGRLL
jgi:hypothetical protein